MTISTGEVFMDTGERREMQREGVRTLPGKRIREEEDRRKSPVSSGTLGDPQVPQKRNSVKADA